MWRPPRKRSESGPLFAGATPQDEQPRLVTQPIVHLAIGETVAAELIPLVARPSRGGSPVVGCFPGRAGGVVDREGWLVQRGAYLAARGTPVHVKLSTQSATDGAFMFRIERAIDRAGADPRFLTFEIDEAFAAQRTAAASVLARTLAGFGCSIAISGCALRFPASAYISRVPADFLKIDPSVVGGVGDDPYAAETIVAVAATAARHELETIAEGLYDEEIVSLLSLAGVGYGQGFPAQRLFL
jgi:EAL domain-containing protein (putative c-di-GMP-specific phosphodiesterase class I)